MVPIGDFRGLDLTPEEGYLLSRIDGRVTVASLLSMLGWEQAKTFTLLESLLRKHVLNFDRQEIAERVFGLGRTEPESTAKSAPPTAPVEASATPGVSIELIPVVEKAPEVEIDPATIEKVPDLDEKRAIEILKFVARVEAAENLYQVFEIPIGADVKSVKRQYRQLAMVFHPDKFFRKEIGGYREKIDVAWTHVQEGYELLNDPARKEAYDKDLLAKQRANPPRATPAPAPVASAPKDPFTPGPPPPAKAPAGVSTDAPEIPPWEKKSSPAAPPEPSRPRLGSAVERKLMQEVQERIGKARRHFDQAKKDLADGKFAAADSNIKLALQFDPRSEEFKSWYESAKPKLETGIVTAALHKAEMAEATNDFKVAQDAYEKALALFPDNPDANMGYGKLLAFRGDNPRKAKECLQKGLRARASDLAGNLAMCRTLRVLGMAKSAQRYIDKCKELAPKDPRVVEEIKELKRAK